MNHPTHHELLLFLDGDTPPELIERVTQHLAACPECRLETEGWKRTAQKLQKLSFPIDTPTPQPRARRRPASQIVKWGLAAAFILFCGIAIGRLSSPKEARIRAAVANDLRPQLLQQLRQDLSIAFAR